MRPVSPSSSLWPLLLIIGCLLTGATQEGSCSVAMKRLYEDLFTDYNRLILPVGNNKTKVTVTLGLKLGQILDLNLKQQILSTNVWVEQTWHDHKLEWQPELYDGIDMIHVPAENIWIPDIVLFNNADGNYELTLVAKATLHYNGTVVWKPPTMFRSTCEIDVEFFPFDIQTCFLRFGSWTYAGDELDLRHVGRRRKVDIGIDLSQFYKNVEWDIIDVPAYYNENRYECCTESHPDITFKIVIRRKMLFYLVNLILPVALMTFMTVSVFYLPSDSNEKVTLSISILTSLIVFFLLMLEIIPASSLAVPLFGKYLLFTLVLVSLSACVSVYVLNIHHRSPAVHSMSSKARQLFLKTLPRLLRLDQPDPRERSSLNRFRKKKIAQQMLNATANNKVYDLAQPMAASLNLIDTLASSYNLVDPNDDDLQLKGGRGIRKSLDDDDEGRYFRRYVDDYIARLKKIKEGEGGGEADGRLLKANGPISGNNCSNCSSSKVNLIAGERRSCCEHIKCCSKANQPLRNSNLPSQAQGAMRSQLQHQHRIFPASCCGGAAMDWTESSGELMCPLLVSSTHGNKFASARNSSGTCNYNCPQQRAFNNSAKKQQSSSSHNHSALCKSSSFGCTARRSYLGMQNDDTLDMTFDYDDPQDGGAGTGATAPTSGAEISAATMGRCHINKSASSAANGNNDNYSGCCGNMNGDHADAGPNNGNNINKGRLVAPSKANQEAAELALPSPPPPPRQLAQLSCDSLAPDKGLAASFAHNSSALGALMSPAMISASAGESVASAANKIKNEANSASENSKLVDKLLSSINLINNASDDIDTTTTSNNEPTEQNNGADAAYRGLEHDEAVGDDVDSDGEVDEDEEDMDESGIDEVEASEFADDDIHGQDILLGGGVATRKHQPRVAMVSANNVGANSSYHGLNQLPASHSLKCGCGAATSYNLQAAHANQQQLGKGASSPGDHLPSGMNGGATFVGNATSQQQQQQQLRSDQVGATESTHVPDFSTDLPSVAPSMASKLNRPSDLLLSLRAPYDRMPAHVRAAIRSILFIADTIKNEDDENSAIEDWESMSMVVDRLFLWIFFILCTFGSIIILALAPSLYDQRASIDDKLRIDIPPSNCSASVQAHS